MKNIATSREKDLKKFNYLYFKRLKMILKCLYCKNEFSSNKSSKKFCSIVCYGDSKKGIEPKWLKENRGVKPSNKKESTCLKCLTLFKHEAGREAKYCSKECWETRVKKIYSVCKMCGNDFMSYKHENKEFCSKGCYSLWQSINFKPSVEMINKAKIANRGENHYN